MQPFDGDPNTKTDMFFRLWLSTLPPKETDTHYRCATGSGSFNWRFKFDVTLPVEGEGLREVCGASRVCGAVWRGVAQCDASVRRGVARCGTVRREHVALRGAVWFYATRRSPLHL